MQINSETQNQFTAFTQFPTTSILTSTERTILYYLEVRSLKNNGDTKIYNSTLAKITGYSIRTIERIINKLVQYHFITRFITRCYDPQNGFYCIRTIRCNRILLINRFNILTKQQLKWKTDNRKIKSISQLNIDLSWLITTNYTFYNNGKAIVVEPKWKTYLDLSKLQLIDLSVVDLYNKIKTLAYIGNQSAQQLLGY